MEYNLTGLGASGILILLVLKETFNFVRWYKNGKPPPGTGCHYDSKCHRKLSELHDWHKPDAETNRFPWYARDLEIIEAIKEGNRELVREIRELRKTLKENGRNGRV